MTATLTAEKATPAPPTSRGRWIEHWEPEDPGFWASAGRKIARRNLIFSILAEHLGFSVWVIWSILVVRMGKLTGANGAPLFPDLVITQTNTVNATKIFWLVALPNLIGAFMRVPYTLAVARFGGRNWTIISGLLLLIPVSLASYCVTHPGTPYWALLACAATAGFGGGNFASSMANISYFFPEKKKGIALGMNAAGGNIGIASMQLVVPVLVAFFAFPLAYAAKIWFPLVLISALCAFLFMNNLHVARASLSDQFAAVKEPHAWVMSFIYIGTFGSFLGLSAAFPSVLQYIFSDPKAKIDKTVFSVPFITTHHGATLVTLLLPFAFLGPLVGSFARPFGGWLADRIGGAKVTAAVFTLMILGSFGAIHYAGTHDAPMFITSMMVLFVMSGTGNGSTYRMIPAIFKRKLDADVAASPGTAAELTTRARRAGAATLGMAGAIGAMGGFILPKAIGDSIKATHGIGAAFRWFIVLYVVCLLVTVVVYLRPGTRVNNV